MLRWGILTTLPPRSRTVCAADNPERPPPTTMTFAVDMMLILEIYRYEEPTMYSMMVTTIDKKVFAMKG